LLSSIVDYVPFAISVGFLPPQTVPVIMGQFEAEIANGTIGLFSID